MIDAFSNPRITTLYNEVNHEIPTVSGQDIEYAKITDFTEWEASWWTFQDGLMVVNQRLNTYNLSRYPNHTVASRTNEAQQLHKLGQTSLGRLLSASGIESEKHKVQSSYSTLLVRYPSPGQFLENTNEMLDNPNGAIRPPVRFQIFEEAEYPADLFIDHFGNHREVLTALKGWHGRHDLVAHNVAWLALTESMVDAAQDKAKKIYDMPSGEARTDAIGKYVRLLDFAVFRPKVARILDHTLTREPLGSASELARLTDRTPQQVIQELRAHVDTMEQ